MQQSISQEFASFAILTHSYVDVASLVALDHADLALFAMNMQNNDEPESEKVRIEELGTSCKTPATFYRPVMNDCKHTNGT